MSTDTKQDFFVSYNRYGKAWAEWIAWISEESGYTVVIQAWDFRPGGNFVLICNGQHLRQKERSLFYPKTISVRNSHNLNGHQLLHEIQLERSDH
jgi:hypothetical protein